MPLILECYDIDNNKTKNIVVNLAIFAKTDEYKTEKHKRYISNRKVRNYLGNRTNAKTLKTKQPKGELELVKKLERLDIDDRFCGDKLSEEETILLRSALPSENYSKKLRLLLNLEYAAHLAHLKEHNQEDVEVTPQMLATYPMVERLWWSAATG